LWFCFETMQKFPLAALRAFAAVYETGGVRPAARALQVTHSAVIRHLRELEAWLGVELFEEKNSKGRIALAPQGQALGKAALAGIAELQRAVESVREMRRPNSVVIATTASFAARWLLPRLPALQKSHAWIEVSVIARQAVLGVTEQGADLALRMGSGPWPDSRCEPIMDEALCPVASRSYWNAIGERQPLRALARARLLHDRDPATSWEKWFTAHPVKGIDLRTGPRFTSSDLCLRAAVHGLGVALARERLAEDDLDSGLLFRPFGSARVSLPHAYWLVQPTQGDMRPAVHAVAEWIKLQARRADSP
jgi:LysR family glycine cleavage system transcriptional activator